MYKLHISEIKNRNIALRSAFAGAYNYATELPAETWKGDFPFLSKTEQTFCGREVWTEWRAQIQELSFVAESVIKGCLIIFRVISISKWNAVDVDGQWLWKTTQRVFLEPEQRMENIGFDILEIL